MGCNTSQEQKTAVSENGDVSPTPADGNNDGKEPNVADISNNEKTSKSKSDRKSAKSEKSTKGNSNADGKIRSLATSIQYYEIITVVCSAWIVILQRRNECRSTISSLLVLVLPSFLFFRLVLGLTWKEIIKNGVHYANSISFRRRNLRRCYHWIFSPISVLLSFAWSPLMRIINFYIYYVRNKMDSSTTCVGVAQGCDTIQCIYIIKSIRSSSSALDTSRFAPTCSPVSPL